MALASDREKGCTIVFAPRIPAISIERAIRENIPELYLDRLPCKRERERGLVEYNPAFLCSLPE